MLTYFIIGLIVQLAIIVERVIRVPEYWTLLEFDKLVTWISLIVAIAINVLAWPLSIIMEIWLVINGL